MNNSDEYTPPDNNLKKKVGEGGLPPHILKKCQNFLDDCPVDFLPHGLRYLKDLQKIMSEIDTGKAVSGTIMADITNVVMQLKSNGSMFHYQLLSMVSEVMLRFMEKAKQPDDDFNDIYKVYVKVIESILNKRLTGDGGREGYELTQELHKACLRYYDKHNIKN